MRDDLPLRFRVGFAVSSVILIAGLATVAVQYGNGYFDDGYEITAVFDQSTQGLDTQSDVKLRGINVGTVESIQLRPDGRAEVTLFIQQGMRIPDTAVGSIEPLSIFGPKFIRLVPGEHELDGPYLAHGEELVETTPPVEFTQVLGNATRLLEGIDPEELVTVIRTVADGVSGLGPELASLLDDTDVLVDIASRHTADTQQFLTDLAALARTLADHGDELVAGSRDLHEVLPALGAGSDELGELLDGLARVSGSVAGLLDGHRPELDATLTALFAVGDTLAAEQEHVVELVSSLDTFFGTLADIIRLPGPHNTMIGALGGPIPENPCALFDPCPLDLIGLGGPELAPTAETAAAATPATAAAGGAAAPSSTTGTLSPLERILRVLFPARGS